MISFSRGARWPAGIDQPFRSFPGRGQRRRWVGAKQVNFFFSRPPARAEPKVLRGAAAQKSARECSAAPPLGQNIDREVGCESEIDTSQLSPP